MDWQQTLRVLLIAGIVAVSGCASEESHESPDENGDSAVDPHDDANSTHPPHDVALEAFLTADVHNGTAPLLVNLTLDATDANATWELDFGDGNNTEGAGLPTTINKTFAQGVFNVTLSVTSGNNTAQAIQAIIVAAANETATTDRTLPATTSWTLGPSGPCIHDLATIGGGPTTPCVGLVAGPDGGADGVDGHWITLGEAYWGLQLTSTIDRGDGHGSSADDWPLYDSDCWFVADDGETQTGDGHNGGAACAAIIPDDTEYVFMSPYGTPALEMIVEVSLPET